MKAHDAMPDRLAPSDRPQPPFVAAAGTPSMSGLMTLAVAVVVVATLYIAQDVLIPIMLAILLSFVLAPVVDVLRWMRLPKSLSVLFAVLLALAVAGSIATLIGTQVMNVATELPRYADALKTKVSTVQGMTTGQIGGLIDRLGGGIKDAADDASNAAQQGTQKAPEAPPEPGAAAGQPPGPIAVEVHEPPPNPLELAERILEPVLAPLEMIIIVFVVAVFILVQRRDLRDRMIRLFGSSDLHRTTVAMNDAARRLSRYFLTQLAVNTAFGCIISVGLYFIGVPSPLLWGLLAGLLRFVPYVGAVIGAVIPLALAAAVDPGWSSFGWTLALFLVTEPIIGHGIEPVLYGHSTGLSPFAVIIAAVFWTWLWGPIGLILSTPLTLCLVVLGRHVERLEFIDVLLGDERALTPVESFYQRMLSGEADDAHDQAEEILKEKSLATYYDEVALRGLQLAANDALRGVLEPGQTQRIKETIIDLVEDLADHDDLEPEAAVKARAKAKAEAEDADEAEAEPAQEEPAFGPEFRVPAFRSRVPVLCIAGRGQLDEGVATILAQLLEKHDLGARVVPHESVSRARIDTLDLEGVGMVCISYLELSGAPSHLRYMLRRLRQRLPKGTPILCGLWPAEDAFLRDERGRGALGADHYTSSLREAVALCLQEAAGEEAPMAMRQPPASPAAAPVPAPAA